MENILIVDDEKSIRDTLREILEYEKYEVDEAPDGEVALDKLSTKEYDVVLCDIKMPKKEGIEVLAEASKLKVTAEFIMISAHGTIDTAVECTKKGAFDFIQKPPDLNRLLLSIKNAVNKKDLVFETKSLRKRIRKSVEIIGESVSIQKIRETIEKVGPTDARVMIVGENGTGKELVARSLHEKSKRYRKALVEVNCAAIPTELIESELFGHEKGSFTSAHKQRIGKFEQANNGTLFLDEIGDMSPAAQAKVLRVLQEKKITRVGGEKTISVDVRVIAATNKNLKKEIEEGNFREDLYHRISVIEINVPPLRNRKEDIPLLIDYFLNQLSKEYNYPTKMICDEAVAALQNLPWTGNIREVRNILERLMIMSNDHITQYDVEQYL